MMLRTSRSMALNKVITGTDCWLWRTLLRWRHRWKIAAWATTDLSVLGAADEPCLNHDKSSAHEENRLRTGSRRKRISFQISLLYTQDSKTCSLVSFATAHRQHKVVMFKPQEASLTLVGSRFSWAIHILNAWFGTHPLNHTTLDQCFFSARGLRTSQVWAEEKELYSFPSTTQQWVSLLVECDGNSMVVKKTCSCSSWSDLGHGSNQPAEEQPTSCNWCI